MHDDEKKAPQDLAEVGGISVGSSLELTSEILPENACIDMLRLKFKHEYSKSAAALQFFDTYRPCNRELGTVYHSQPTPISRYEYVYKFPSGDSSITAGLFLNDGTKRDVSRTKPADGFIEFNPQKVDHNDLDRILPWLFGRYELHVSRWDFACDYRLPRTMFSLDKGYKNWDAHLSRGALTETTGKRNHDGYIKVYDKAKESHVEGYPVTRVEVTNDGKNFQWPIVYVLREDKAPTKNSLPVLRLIMSAVNAGVPFEDVIASAFDDSRSRTKWRELFRELCEQAAFPSADSARCLSELARWECGEVVPRQNLFWENDVKSPVLPKDVSAGQAANNG